MTFESEELLIVTIYIWLPQMSYVCSLSDNSGLFYRATAGGGGDKKKNPKYWIVNRESI